MLKGNSHNSKKWWNQWEEISESVRKIKNDKKSKHLVLRVNSPGSSSFYQWFDMAYEIENIKAAGKPVVYFIWRLCGVRRILYFYQVRIILSASRNTLTGSIEYLWCFGCIHIDEWQNRNQLWYIENTSFYSCLLTFNKLTDAERKFYKHPH